MHVCPAYYKNIPTNPSIQEKDIWTFNEFSLVRSERLLREILIIVSKGAP